MEKPKRPSQMGPMVLALSLFFSAFSLSKTFVYADDSLSTLQQEVIFAKEKHQAVAGKASVVSSMLDQDKTSVLQNEADRLIQELTEKGYTHLSPVENPVKVQEKALPAVEMKPQGPKPVDIRLTPSPQQTTQKEVVIKQYAKKQAPKKEKWYSPEAYRPKQFSEADALYRVAVSDKKVNLKEAEDLGLAGNVQLQALKKKVEVADAKLTETKRALFPTVQATVDYNGGINVGRFYKGEAQKINVNQPIFHGGELIFTMHQAEENVKASKEEYQKARNEFIQQIRTAFYGVVKAEYNAQYQFELYEKVNTLYKRIQEEHRQKLISEVDFLNAESQYQQVYFQVESARNDLLSADLLFHQALSLTSDQELPIDLKLKFVKVDPVFDEVLELSLKTNPDIEIAEHHLISSEYGVKIYKAKKLPRVDLRGSYGYLGEVNKDTIEIAADNADLDTEKEWFLGVHASMPLGPNSVEYDQVKNVFGPTVLALTGSEAWRHRATFNLFDRFADVTDEKSAEAAWLQSRADYQKAKNDLTVKLRDHFYELEKSLIQIDSSVARMRYQEKQNGILEYLLGLQETTAANYFEGLVQLAQNKFSFIQAVTDYDLALSDLGVSIGDPNYFDKEA